jgi:beta-lactamase regulating signal transducer with metallopeptidase domain
VIAHLLLSTLVLAIAIIAARLLPLTARTRHALLLAGLATFALPSSAVAALLRALDLTPKVTAIPMPLRVFGGGATVNAVAHINWIPYVWIAIAAAMFGRWLILRTRTIAAALRTATAPSAREIDALAYARRTLRITTAVDLLRSPICEAPAVIRILRPTILLPDCESLDDDELRTLLLHECAHVARRDNLATTIETLFASLLWFHPLVWLALRDLAVTREEACDELVADTASSSDTYLRALTKVCRAVLGTRAAGASCMASAQLTERIEHLMNYATLKQKAFSHRGVLATAIAAVLFVTTAATALSVEEKKNLRQVYRPIFGTATGGSKVVLQIELFESSSNRFVTAARFEVPAGAGWKALELKDGARDITLRMRGISDGTGELMIEARENNKLIQRNLYAFTPKTTTYTGEPISLNLKDADMKDVLNTFAQITGYDLVMNRAVEGKTVTIDVTGMPWDEALQKIATDSGVTIRIEGKKIVVDR